MRTPAPLSSCSSPFGALLGPSAPDSAMKKTLAVLGMLLLGGCGDPTGGATAPTVVIGTIDAGGTLDGVITGPTVGRVGERLIFSVTTFGDSCVSPVGAQVIVQGLQLTVIPYDRVSGTACLRYLRSYPRDVAITFDRAGEANIRVQGRSFTRSGLVTVTYPVNVLP